MKSGVGAFSEEIKKKFGTVWTDQRVVDLTFNEALKFFKGDLNTATFCDPACGDGNFLVTFYRHLVSISPIQDPVEKSLDTLRRIYGVDIIDRMTAAAQFRLITEHVKFLKSVGLDLGTTIKASVPAATEIVKRNIIHGNTLRTEGDGWELAMMEGGLTPGWFRELKFDVICGNPPYTRYKDNRGKDLPTPLVYKQPNMAASFWQWCVEHVSAIGVYGLNVTSTILNSDSAARRLHANQITSILCDELTKTYSRDAGGDLPTLVLVGMVSPDGLVYNNKPVLDTSLLYKGRFLTAIDYTGSTYRTVPINTRLASGRGNGSTNWQTVICDGIIDAAEYHIAFAHVICGTTGRHEQYKLIGGGDPNGFIATHKIGTAGKGKAAFFTAGDRERAWILWCFLNSSLHLYHELPKYGKQLLGTGRIAKTVDYKIWAMDFAILRVPDVAFYKATKPVEFQAVLDFAGAHIQSGDVKSYCVGVDKVINDLLEQR